VIKQVHGWLLRIFGHIPWTVQRILIGAAKPSFVVGTTAAVTDRQGRILLVRHSYKPGWSTPGGFLNRREAPADAAVREVWEELGIRVTVVGEPVCIVRTEERIVELVHRARPIDEAAAARVTPMSAEIAEARWFDLDDLPDLSVIARNGLESLAAAEAQRAEFAGPPFAGPSHDGPGGRRITRTS
jgi:ADP-ribose pyrophosphatase YjhB (NUDIX family)